MNELIEQVVIIAIGLICLIVSVRIIRKGRVRPTADDMRKELTIRINRLK